MMGAICKGICNRYKPKWRTGTPRYTVVSCRCTTCEVWLDTLEGTTNYRCNCCHALVSTRPKIKLRLVKARIKTS